MTDSGLLDDGVSHCSHRHYDEDEMGRIALDKNHILVGCTGSVASLLTPRLVEELASLKYNVCNTFAVARMNTKITQSRAYKFKLIQCSTGEDNILGNVLGAAASAVKD